MTARDTYQQFGVDLPVVGRDLTDRAMRNGGQDRDVFRDRIRIGVLVLCGTVHSHQNFRRINLEDLDQRTWSSVELAIGVGTGEIYFAGCDSDDRLWAYVRGAVFNKAREMLRLREYQATETSHISATDAAARVEEGIARDALDLDAVRRLPEKVMWVVVTRRLGWTFSEMSEVTGIPERTLRYRFRVAVDALGSD